MIKVRKAQIKDILAMTKLWQEMMKYHKKLDPYFYNIKKSTKSHKRYLKKNIQAKNSGFFVALYNGRIVGYVGGWIEERPPCYIIRKNGYLGEEIVTKEFRKKGIGKKLTAALMKWFKQRKMPFVMLRTHSKNKPGIQAWKRGGFSEKLKVMFKKL